MFPLPRTAIFQVFCALLWLLDEYWSYTLFTLFSVVAYEATTVFQRTRTQKMLGGMAAAASPIYAYRYLQCNLRCTRGNFICCYFRRCHSNVHEVPIFEVFTYH